MAFKVTNLVLLSLLAGANSFAFQVNPSKASLSLRTAGLTKLYAEDEVTSDSTAPTLTSGRKEIAYDETSGRFFETNIEEPCIPEDEYCVVDDTTGELVRLTLEEKERIFLDALQVKTFLIFLFILKKIMCFFIQRQNRFIFIIDLFSSLKFTIQNIFINFSFLISLIT